MKENSNFLSMPGLLLGWGRGAPPPNRVQVHCRRHRPVEEPRADDQAQKLAGPGFPCDAGRREILGETVQDARGPR